MNLRVYFKLFVVIGIILAVHPLAVFATQTPPILAAPPSGQAAFEFVSQIDQSNFDLVISGYLTHVNGVSSDALFVEGTNPAERNEAVAYFTFQATGSIYSRSVLESIFNTNAQMTLTIYYHETPAATFADTTTFAAGTPVATYSIRLQNILNVQSPDVGIALSAGDGIQTESVPFQLNGQETQFGQVDMTLRFNAFGQGFRQSIEPLVVRLLTAGNAVVSG